MAKNACFFLILLAFLIPYSLKGQWSGTSPLWTTSNVSIGTNTPLNSRLFVNGSTCGSRHALAIRQPNLSCVFPDVLGDLIRVDVDNVSSINPAFVVNSYGYVGVGTYTPIKPLHVNGVGYFEYRLGIGTALPQAPLHVIGNSLLIGNVGVNTAAPSEMFHISGGNILLSNGDLIINNGSQNNLRFYSNGLIRSRQIDVDLLPIPDYVFQPTYNLMSISALENYIKNNSHLPGIKSAKEYEETGSLNIGELTVKLLEKIEEQSLYIIELHKRLEKLEKAQANTTKQ